MKETAYAEAKRNRERREALEKRRQHAVTTAFFLRGHPTRELEVKQEPVGWQVPASAEIIAEALELWIDRAKTQILALDQEFDRL